MSVFKMLAVIGYLGHVGLDIQLSAAVVDGSGEVNGFVERQLNTHHLP